MEEKALGKHLREGITFIELMKKFPNNDEARNWFEKRGWENGACCPHCGSFNVQSNIKHKTMTHRCRDCQDRKMFSLKTGTVMEGSKLNYQIWAIAIYLLTTNLKGVSSTKLHRDLGITQKSAWHLAHRLRKSYELEELNFLGTGDVDETYMGRLEKNKRIDKKLNSGRGAVGKTSAIGAKERESKTVKAEVIENTESKTLHEFIDGNLEEGSDLFTEEFKRYEKLEGNNHESVKHSVGEYANEQVHINGMESFWSMLKRAYKEIYHKISKKHLNGYVEEFAGRYNNRENDTIDQLKSMVEGMEGKKLRYKDFVSGVDGRLV